MIKRCSPGALRRRGTRVSVSSAAHSVYEDSGYSRRPIGSCHRHSRANGSLRAGYVSLHCWQGRSDYDMFRRGRTPSRGLNSDRAGVTVSQVHREAVAKQRRKIK